MNDDVFERQVKTALYAIAPDLEGEAINAVARYHDQFDFDSIDFMRFVIELHRLTGIDIPERDYPRLETLAGAVDYLREKSTC